VVEYLSAVFAKMQSDQCWFAQGLRADLSRRLPYYISDYKDGMLSRLRCRYDSCYHVAFIPRPNLSKTYPVYDMDFWKVASDGFDIIWKIGYLGYYEQN